MNTACTSFSFRGSNKYLSKSATYWPQIDQSIQSSEISVVYIGSPTKRNEVKTSSKLGLAISFFLKKRSYYI